MARATTVTPASAGARSARQRHDDAEQHQQRHPDRLGDQDREHGPACGRTAHRVPPVIVVAVSAGDYRLSRYRVRDGVVGQTQDHQGRHRDDGTAQAQDPVLEVCERPQRHGLGHRGGCQPDDIDVAELVLRGREVPSLAREQQQDDSPHRKAEHVAQHLSDAAPGQGFGHTHNRKLAKRPEIREKDGTP